MAYIEWDDSLSVGDTIIDMQHRQLIGFINQLHDAMSHGQGQVVLDRILLGLTSYVSSHFAMEEYCFESTQYPDTYRHLQAHREFEAKVHEFRDGFDKGTVMLTLDVMDFLSEWLVGHIRDVDQGYKPFVADKPGLEPSAG